MQVALPATESSHVGEIRRRAIRMAEFAGLPDGRRSDAAIIATEIATNLVRHAQGGQVWLQTLFAGEAACLELMAVDSGPGIADVRQCLQDGYSTAGTAGTGLGAVRRLADEFDVFSIAKRGTVVFARLYVSPARRSSAYAVGAVSLPAPHETACGDCWRVIAQESSIAIMVADGLGHGPLAAEAADQAAEVFTARPFIDAQTFYATAHQRLGASRGAAVARALVLPSGRLQYSGIGNIAGSLVGPESSRGLPSQNGTVGVQLRSRIAVPEYDWPARGVLLMHSDGLGGRWSMDAYPGLIVRHPAVIAAVLFRDFVRGRDDATIVAVTRTLQSVPA